MGSMISDWLIIWIVDCASPQVAPWHWYFTSALPRALLCAPFLVLISLHYDWYRVGVLLRPVCRGLSCSCSSSSFCILFRQQGRLLCCSLFSSASQRTSLHLLRLASLQCNCCNRVSCTVRVHVTNIYALSF